MANTQTKTVDVFKSVVYRIPALFYETESNTLLAFAEQRETEANCTAKELVMRRGTLKDESPGVKTIEWSELKTVVEKAKLDNYRPLNPCPVFEKNTKTLFLFFICVEDRVEEQWQIKNRTNKARLCYITSEDLGQNWSEVTDLTYTLGEIKNWATFAVGPGHGLQMKKGRLIVPVYAYVCSSSSKSNEATSYAFALYSDDRGSTWKLGQMLQTQSGECQMAEIFDGDKSSIYCNACSQGG
ncbi:sialidase-2-like isoform X1 [Lates calcarifer]|uniref:exo-alpha-sialidase n=1 Tax=Lates calcarifer TaxID=8187 RepID=A0AAJ7PEE7_LATCA|nr:sialidase-2-like isoform X1 [Lates calcarifer]